MRFAICFLTLLAPGFGTDCTPTGTWYGGSENGAKYLLTVIPSTPYYTVIFQAAFKPRVPVLTRYSGEMTHVKAKTFDIYAIAMVNTSELPPDPGADSTLPQVWAIRSRAEISDCNTLDLTIDFFAAYNWRSDLVPYLDPPDTYRLSPGNLIREKYHRVTTEVCTSCPMRDDDKPAVPEMVFTAPAGPVRKGR